MFKPNHESNHIPIPATHEAAGARNNGVGETIREVHTAAPQPYKEPSAKGHPALKHLKQANHVHEVFKKQR